MRRLVLTMLTGMGMFTSSTQIFAQASDAPVMTICIHDYAHLSNRFVHGAQRYVTELYAAIGVRTVWAETLRPTELHDSVQARDPNELLINILPPAMSDKLDLGDRVLGMSAVTLREGGRVAYVMFDRVSRVANTIAPNPPEMLGLVIAHELGHLLLPRGSHSPVGIMRPAWRPGDYRGRDGQPPHFTRAQAYGIRDRLSRQSSSASSSLAPLAAE